MIVLIIVLILLLIGGGIGVWFFTQKSKKCDTGFTLIDGTCVKDTTDDSGTCINKPDQYATEWNTDCSISNCQTGFYVNNNVCIQKQDPNKKCTNKSDPHAVTWNDDCSIKTCDINNNYILSKNSCIPKPCVNKVDPNALTWDATCNISNCKPTFLLSNGSCIMDPKRTATDIPILNVNVADLKLLYVYQGAGDNAPPGFTYTWDIPGSPSIAAVNSQSELANQIGKLPIIKTYKYIAITKTGPNTGWYYAALGNTLPTDGFRIPFGDPAFNSAVIVNTNLFSGYKCCESYNGKDNSVKDKNGKPLPNHIFMGRGGCTWVIYQMFV
jgi:hypothetical protein